MRFSLIVFFLMGFFLLPFSSRAVDFSTATGKTITFDNATGVATIEGNAVVSDSTATLKADVISVDTKSKIGRAKGNVVLQQSSATITGAEAEYYWASSTGIIRGATGLNDPWRFTADELIQTSTNYYLLSNGDITSCEEVPPHYQIRARRGKMRRGKRIKLYRPWFVAGGTPSVWLPFYTRSLEPKKYRLRIEPGYTSRDGYTTRTIFGYPYTSNSYTDIRWDYLQRTGNGAGINHRYFAPKQKGDLNWYYIRDTNPDGKNSRRYTVLWDHFQRFTSRWTMNSKIDLKSDQIFGNQFPNTGDQVFVENQTRGVLSESGLTYQFPRATLQARIERQDKFDSSISSENFISHLTLPSLTFNTIPLTGRYFPLYASFSGSFTNDTIRRDDPTQDLRYKRAVNAGTEMKKDIRVAKRWTFTPIFGFNETWQNRNVTSTATLSENEMYVGRYSVGMDVRRRFRGVTDGTLGYRYGARNRQNQTLQDIDADDRGVETNQLTGSLVTQLGRSTRVTLASGYDLRGAPRSQPDKYQFRNERVTPPSLDVQWEARRNVNVYFRETYSVFDQNTRSIVRTPVNTSGELQLGDLMGATFFSQGFSFTKPSPGQPSELILTNKLKFYLTPKWYLDFAFSYRAVGSGDLDYRRVFPIEKSIRVVRDMHCWLLRMEFARRPGITEASFYIDLKANLTPQRNIFSQYRGSVYSTRDDGPDVGQIFPVKKNGL